LLRNNRKHLDVDPVELVEARPTTALREALEELAHKLCIQILTAVKDNALTAG
jgi:hypothetical protein